MPGRLHRWRDTAISIADLPGDSADDRHFKRMIVGVLWLSAIPMLVTTWVMIVQYEAPGAAYGMLVMAIVTAATLLAIWRRPTWFPDVLHVVVCGNIVVSASYVVLFGGLLASGANSMWGFLAVVAALVVFGDWRATVWLVTLVVTTIGAAIWASATDPRYSIRDPETGAVFNLIAVGTIIYLVLRYYIRQREMFRQRSERLLRNILPDEVAERLKTSDERIADRFDTATILFADVAGFTPMSSGLSPEALVDLLDEVFTAFDDLVDERGLEKIKTIGDAYMVAAGVPSPRPDHAHAICDLALAMRDLVGTRSFQGHEITFRIGINSGPVVAGIIGRRKFSYDLWGDAVNTASRMESQGIAGAIQITASTRALVEDAFVCAPRGSIDVKGKGEMPIWHVIERRGRSGADTVVP
jgi:adenylate cyclase